MLSENQSPVSASPFGTRAPTSIAELNRLVGKPTVKGNAILGAIDFARDKNAKYWPQIEAKLTEETRATIKKGILAASWYPIALFCDIVHTMCKEIPGDPKATAVEWGGFVLARDMQGGVYKAFLRVASAQFVLKSITLLWSVYQGSGKLVVMSERDKSARMLCYGLAVPSELIWRGTLGSAAKIVELCHFKNVTHKIISGGGPTDQYLEFELAWD
jgi:hypothetical protein